MWSFKSWRRTGVAMAIAFAAFAAATLTAGSSAALADDASDWLGRAFPASEATFRASRLGGPTTQRTSKRGRAKGVQVASLGGSYMPAPAPAPSLSGGGPIRWIANAGCLSAALHNVIAAVAAQFGAVTVSSTCRSHAHNRRVGGARRSYHLTGSAADFRVHGNVRGAYAYLSSSHGGGLKHYGRGLFHIDTGPRRRF
jgi:hypothetical protein